MTRLLDLIEIPAVIATMLAAIMLARDAAAADFVLVYILFLSSSAIITMTTYFRKAYNIMALNLFYVAVNSYALLNV